MIQHPRSVHQATETVGEGQQQQADARDQDDRADRQLQDGDQLAERYVIHALPP
jgi:hypothetical protein